MDNETVTISAAEYRSLLIASAHLSVLEARGVDNWQGYTGSHVYCTECDAENTVADALCDECGAELPDKYDY